MRSGTITGLGLDVLTLAGLGLAYGDPKADPTIDHVVVNHRAARALLGGLDPNRSRAAHAAVTAALELLDDATLEPDEGEPVDLAIFLSWGLGWLTVQLDQLKASPSAVIKAKTAVARFSEGVTQHLAAVCAGGRASSRVLDIDALLLKLNRALAALVPVFAISIEVVAPPRLSDQAA